MAQGIGHDAAHVRIFEAVDDALALALGRHEPPPPKLSQVVRERGLLDRELGAQLADRRRAADAKSLEHGESHGVRHRRQQVYGVLDRERPGRLLGRHDHLT